MTPEKYQQLYDTMIIRPDRATLSNSIALKIKSVLPKYEAVASATGVPVLFIAITHSLEASSRFDRHLHNGDPLTARTVQVPKGRPVKGNPPFTWAESAIDALQLLGLDKVKDWSIPNMLLTFEKYNGMGYQKRGINTPYLWSWCNHYTAGKFVADGHFDPAAVSQQCGAAILLKLLLK